MGQGMPRMRSNADLVRAAQRGEAASLEELFRRLQPRMRAVVMSCSRDHADAEDACQDAAVLAIARIGELRGPQAVPQWLTAIVRNACHAIAGASGRRLRTRNLAAGLARRARRWSR
jgi:RNA polymerase sigma-70 factor (ECF subfamily)